MRDWHIFGILLEELTSSMIITWFMVMLAANSLLFIIL
jgi:hypothetical protein